MLLTLALAMCACSPAAPPTEPPTQVPVTEPPAQQESSGFASLIQRYAEAVAQNRDGAQMMEQGLNDMIPGCLEQDERAHVGYFLGDLNGDGKEELAIAASSESEFYTGLIFELYTMEGDDPVLLAASSDRNRWYYAGPGKLLNIASSGAAESGWYLCGADRALGFLDAVEYNAAQYPDDPWLRFTGSGWEHISANTADQAILDLSGMVRNLELISFV